MATRALKRGRAHRATTLGSQALSSLTNLAPGVYAAHALDSVSFGVFALIQLSYIVSLGLLRSGISEVAVLREHSSRVTANHHAALDATGLCVVAGVLAALPFTALADSFEAMLALVALATAIGVSLLQDCARMVSIGIGRGGWAAASDLSWLAFAFLLLGTVELAGRASPIVIACAWTAAALPGTVLNARQLSWRPHPARGYEFIREHGRLSMAFVGDWAMRSGVGLGTMYAVGAAGGIAVIGHIRAAQIVTGPLNVVFAGLQFAYFHTLTAQMSDTQTLLRYLRWLSAGLGVTALAYGAMILSLPVPLLAIALGDQSEALREYSLPVFATLVAAGFASGGALGLRVLGAARVLTMTRLITSAVIVASATAGWIAWRSPLIALWCFAAGNLAMIPLWNQALKRCLEPRVP